MSNVTVPSDPSLAKDTPLLSATAPTIKSPPGLSSVSFISRDYPEEILIPSSAHTFEGFRQWALSENCPERGRFTFVSGKLIVDMSPESIENHNFLKTEITSVIHERSKRKHLGRVYSDGCLLSNQDAQVSTEPDAAFATYETLRAGRCQVMRSSRPGVSQELVGAPEWVLEIVSPWSRRKDKQLLREGYFHAGVREYWLIDALGDEIEFQLLVPGVGAFVVVEPQDGWLASPSFGCSFQLTREKGEDGLWLYTLHVREAS